MNINRFSALSRLTLVMLVLVGVSSFSFIVKPVFSQESVPEGSNAWSSINIPALNDGNKVYAVRRSGALLLAGTQNQGMFLSADSGASWQAIAPYNTAYVRDLWINNSTLLAATFGSGLLRSTDNGGAWEAVGGNIGTNFFYSLVSGGSILFVATADRGVWRSSDNGVSWQPTGTIGSPGAVALAAASPSVVYAGSVNNGLYRTADGGASWQQIGFAGKTVRAIALDPNHPLVIWVSVLGDGIYRSDNGGGSWVALNTGLNGATVLSLLAVSANGTTQVLAGTAGSGVLRWSGSAWQLDGLAGSEIYALASWNATMYAGTNHKVWEYTYLPTPGLRSFVLRNEPYVEINAGEEITYQISYRNGSIALSAFEITDIIPVGVQLVPGSISNSGTSTGSQPGDTVRWTLGTLDANAAGTVLYRVQRPGNTSTPLSTATQTPTPTATRTPTPTAFLATATWTPASTPTPTPTVTATATPTATPTVTPAALAIQLNLTATPNPAVVNDTIRYTISVVDTGHTGFTQVEITDVYTAQCMNLTGAAIWPPNVNTSGTALWSNVGSLAVNGQMQFWIDFKAVDKCNGPRNENVVTVKAYLGAQSISREVSLQVPIANHSPEAQPGFVDFDPAASYTVVVITNDGAMATWTVNNIPGQMHSNTVSNPSRRAYLPLVLR